MISLSTGLRLSKSRVFYPTNQIRSLKTLSFGGSQEVVYERADCPPDQMKSILNANNQVQAVIGYGTQGRAQSLNMRDNGVNVLVGLRKNGQSWNKAVSDGWVEGETLFEIEDALSRGTTIMNLLSDAGQKENWPLVSKYLTKGKTLYFSHGFSVIFNDYTHVKVPADVDVILVAPKGSGTTLRSLFLEGRGINSSIAIQQDYSGAAKQRAIALGVAIGSGYMYETTFKKEVVSDLTGERGILMGAIQGLFKAQYDVLRANGHSPSEAFNETVEEATQSLYPLIGKNGMDWMYANCSTTAQRGALDWYPRFYEATRPVFEDLYRSVEEGAEAKRTLETCGLPDYRERLEVELKELRDSEMWRAGETVRQLRPENQISSGSVSGATANSGDKKASA